MAYLKLFAAKNDVPFVVVRRAVKIAHLLDCDVEVNYTPSIKMLVNARSDMSVIAAHIELSLTDVKAAQASTNDNDPPAQDNVIPFTDEAIERFQLTVDHYKKELLVSTQHEAKSMGRTAIEPVDVYQASMVIAESSPTYIPHEKFKMAEDKTHKRASTPSTSFPDSWPFFQGDEG